MRSLRLVLAVAVLMSAAVAQSGDLGKPQLIPNSHKYRANGFQPSTGRSGSALMKGTALLRNDGTTTIELTSGVPSASDSGILPNGNIEKVQYKLLNGATTVQTLNWKPLHAGSQFAQDVAGAAHNQHMQLQANLTGIDRNRTDVVTVTTSVLDRPDLRISELAPQSGLINTPISISATVQELKGDLGANADCVLYVDGLQADRVSGMWVAPKGTVTCETTHTFSTPGPHALKMTLENISPGDWDSSNNSAQNLVMAAA